MPTLQFRTLFEHNQDTDRRSQLHIKGRAFFVHSQTTSCAVAVSHKKTFGLVASLVSTDNMLLSVYRWPKLAQQVVPRLESFCDVLR